MFDRKRMKAAFGGDFTSKKQVLDAVGWKDYASVNPYFYGLPRIGKKYWTDDVIDKMLADVKYSDTEDWLRSKGL